MNWKRRRANRAPDTCRAGDDPDTIERGELYADVRVGSLILVVPVAESHLAVMTLHHRPERISWR